MMDQQVFSARAAMFAFTRAILSKNIEKRSSDALRARRTQCDHLSRKRVGLDPQIQRPAGLCASDPHEPRAHVKGHCVAVILSPPAWKTDTNCARGTVLCAIDSLFYPLIPALPRLRYATVGIRFRPPPTVAVEEILKP